MKKNIHELIIDAIEKAILEKDIVAIGPSDIRKIVNESGTREKELHYETAKKVLNEFIKSYHVIKKLEESEGYTIYPHLSRGIPVITIMPKDIFHEFKHEYPTVTVPITTNFKHMGSSVHPAYNVRELEPRIGRAKIRNFFGMGV